MGKKRLAWVSGTVLILILIAMGSGLYFKQRYCWDCTAEERYACGAELLCNRDADERTRGVAFIGKAASQGLPEAQSLAGELYLQPLPGRYASINQDLIECVSPFIVADRDRARSYFQALGRAGQVSPNMEFNLGVLIEEGLLDSPQPDKAAAVNRANLLRSALLG